MDDRPLRNEEGAVMRALRFAVAFVSLLGAVGMLARADDPKGPPDQDPADALFKAGKFAEAEKLCSLLVVLDPANARLTSRLGQLALLANRLDTAQMWLDKTLKLSPDDASAQLLLAEVFYRRDDFARASALFKSAGQEAKARQLESLAGAGPYQIEAKTDKTSVKFVMTDPLPLVKVRVNGGEEVNFTIDTGAAEVVLDSDFARRLGVKTFGSRTGTFAGGKQAPVQFGRIDTLTVGDFAVRNVPVHVMPTRPLSGPIFGGKPVDGILGTVLLYHFLSTLDYPQGRLVLQRKSSEASGRLQEQVKGGKAIAVPFWMAGDHYMVAWGQVEKTPPVLLFVDTGLAGGGVTLARSVIDAAGIKLAENQAGEGLGGGGRVKVVPFQVKELGLGDAKERNVRGLFTDPFPPEHRFGFRIGGIISHGFFRRYALTFDFTAMQLILQRKG
jgi:predicted aspartyl protease